MSTIADFGTIEPNALTPNIRAFWDITSEARIDVETVHRLTNLGAVVAHATHATSQEGFEIESGEIIILMVDGDLTQPLRNLQRGRPRRRARTLRGTAPAGAAAGKHDKPSGRALPDLLRGP